MRPWRGDRPAFARAALAWGAAVLAFLAPSLVLAHDQPFGFVDVRWGGERIELELTLHRDDAAQALRIATPESLTQSSFLDHKSGRLAAFVTSRVHVQTGGRDLGFRLVRAEARPDKRGVSLRLMAPLEQPISYVRFEGALFPENTQYETFLNVYDARGRVVLQDVLTSSHTSAEVYDLGVGGILAVLGTFIGAGIHHIFIGPDHILFIIGLLLLGGSIGRVLRVATSFTVAHTFTLALSVLGIVRLPGRVVEPVIALSVAYIGFENLRARVGGADWRTRIAFAFGLIHGFGFASVLREVGLAHGALACSLLGFNIGVEIGQAGIILVIVPLLAALRASSPRLASRAIAGGSWAIIGAGGFWFVERVLAG